MELNKKIIASGTTTLFRNKFKYTTELFFKILYLKENVFWENRSNTLVSEKWHADITPSPTTLRLSPGEY
jgi:hypothetical protein